MQALYVTKDKVYSKCSFEAIIILSAVQKVDRITALSILLMMPQVFSLQSGVHNRAIPLQSFSVGLELT